MAAQLHLADLACHLNCTYQILHVSSFTPFKQCVSARLHPSIVAAADVTPQSLKYFPNGPAMSQLDCTPVLYVSWAAPRNLMWLKLVFPDMPG